MTHSRRNGNGNGNGEMQIPQAPLQAIAREKTYLQYSRKHLWLTIVLWVLLNLVFTITVKSTESLDAFFSIREDSVVETLRILGALELSVLVAWIISNGSSYGILYATSKGRVSGVSSTKFPFKKIWGLYVFESLGGIIAMFLGMFCIWIALAGVFSTIINAM